MFRLAVRSASPLLDCCHQIASHRRKEAGQQSDYDGASDGGGHLIVRCADIESYYAEPRAGEKRGDLKPVLPAESDGRLDRIDRTAHLRANTRLGSRKPS